MSNDEKESKYLQYLPSVYQVKEEDGSPSFLGRFLLAFEKILSGIDDDVSIDNEPVAGIEERLNRLHNLFDPALTDGVFLQWLAGCVALTLKDGEGWNEDRKRELISRIVPLYRKRGTKEGLEEYLEIYAGGGVKIIDELDPLRIGYSSHVGVDTKIGGLPEYYFMVDVPFSASNPQVRSKRENAVKEIIDIEKPAHTYYTVRIITSTMRVGFAKVEVNTLLW